MTAKIIPFRGKLIRKGYFNPKDPWGLGLARGRELKRVEDSELMTQELLESLVLRIASDVERKVRNASRRRYKRQKKPCLRLVYSEEEK